MNFHVSSFLLWYTSPYPGPLDLSYLTLASTSSLLPPICCSALQSQAGGPDQLASLSWPLISLHRCKIPLSLIRYLYMDITLILFSSLSDSQSLLQSNLPSSFLRKAGSIAQHQEPHPGSFFVLVCIIEWRVDPFGITNT